MSLTVDFTDESTPGPSGPITARAWDFGDSNTSTDESPSHTYAEEGLYGVTLTVTGSGSDGTATVEHGVVVVDPGSPGFVSLTSWARPMEIGDATREVPFTTKAELDAAIADMAAGDYIYYNGTGVLEISTTTAETLYSLSGKNPASLVVIDLGVARSEWGVDTTSDYVKFVQNKTSADGNTALFVGNCSNIAIYGGEFTSTGIGINMRGTLTNVYLLDAWVHDVAESGIWMIPSTSSGGVATIQHCTVRAEVGPNWCMNPAIDNHTDKGTGQHCCLLFDSGNGSSFKNNTIAIYGHDSLAPGDTSYGKTWPEGGGGSVIEIGQSPNVGTASGSGNTLYALGENNLMIPDGSNPGSTGHQTGGNVFDLWGAVPLVGLVIGWAEGNNISGAVVQTNGSGWHSTPIVVEHGRATDTNQSTAGGNIADPYPTTSDVTYEDCT